MIQGPTIFIVDDDQGMRKSLSLLLESEGFIAESFASAIDFLRHFDPNRPGCLILDFNMPHMTGLELQERLAEEEISLPVILVSAYADVATAVKSMRLGSIDVIEKPYSSEAMIERVREAIEKDRKNRLNISLRAELRARLASLTTRETEILKLMVEGKQSKAIADFLGLSVSTVDNHRSKIMKRVHAESQADLVRIVMMAYPPDLSQC